MNRAEIYADVAAVAQDGVAPPLDSVLLRQTARTLRFVEKNRLHQGSEVLFEDNLTKLSIMGFLIPRGFVKKKSWFQIGTPISHGLPKIKKEYHD